MLVLRLSLVALALAACREPGGAAPDGSADAMVASDAAALTPGLRVATVNLRCLLEDWSLRVPLIVAELAELDLDVIALQEVCREEGGADALTDLTTLLDAATGKSHQSVRAETHVAWDKYQEGIALLTPHTIKSMETVALPTGVFPRKALLASIEPELISGQSVALRIAVTHLSFGDDQASVRVQQLGALRAALQASAVVGESLFIAGDMNEKPNGEAISAALADGYQDSWAQLNPFSDGPTYPAELPRTRIDYILFSPASDAMQARQAMRFLETPTEGRYASDHLGVWADFGAP